MFRVDDPSAVPTLPTPSAAGTPGYFTEGVPGVTPATLVRADFLNMVQDELMAIVTAAGLTPSKTTRNQVLTALAGRLLRTSIYINSGGTLQVSVNGGAFGTASSTFTALANTTACDVEVQGGGGGGGGTQGTSAGQAAAGGGGGAGGYAFKRYTSGFSGITITVASATTPVAGVAGPTGNTSSFGALLSALGGGGGVQGPAATLDGRYFGTAGGGSVSGAADFATAGGQGGSASYSTSGTVSGAGGTSHFAPGAGSVTPNSNGLSGGYGGGGGGAATAASQAGYTGGIGGAGIIIIREYA